MTTATDNPRTDGAPDPGAAASAPLVFDIGGMSCAACASRIERKVSKLEGVSEARVNFATERAAVTGLPELSAADIVACVERTGYTASLHESEEAGAAESQARSRMLLWRLIVAALLALPLGDLTITLALVPSLRFTGWTWVSVLMAVPVVFWSAWPFHKATLRDIRQMSFGMDALVSIGVMASFVWSTWTLLISPSTEAGYWLGFGVTPAGADSIYLDVAAGVTTFLLAGRYFEARSRRAASDVLNALNALGADTARIIADGVETVRPIDMLMPGEHIVVKAGETVPADGTIDEGSADIDTSMMTGEPAPRELGPGDEVLAGTISTNGRLVVTATRVGRQTELAQMAALAGRAQEGKARIQRLADRIASVFVPVVMAIALITFGAWLLSGAELRTAFGTGLAVLIIACPCALGLATPTALMVGVGRGSQLGILIKSHEALEASGSIDTVVFDKTGTVTSGSVLLTRVWAPGRDKTEVIRSAAALERLSEHPLGAAVTRYADRNLDAVPAAADFAVHPGLGVSGTVDGRRVLVGSRTFLAGESIDVPNDAAELIDGYEKSGTIAVLVGIDGRLAGVLGLGDKVRPSAVHAMEQLASMKLRTVLLTGDSERTARAVADRIGVDEVIAGVLPAGKVDAIRSLQDDGRRVAMVGDGINDAAALATANLGLAVGKATDIALKSADMILVREDLSVVPDAVRLAGRTLRTIRLNLLWAFGYNVAAIPLAAFGLLNPLIAGAAMSLSSLLVVTNSLRLKNVAGSVPDEDDS
ncbi:heavy metal translocating P-type ATPase [Spelaeicoccus albus]|uniref:Cu+-exporting ATPase n=1 Tax=Spelaeicoccus albus TaxID=1280376 RepID=A0A7Z0D0F2_9MICO|nr:heavy metal translocating P-type ATPase [Spelaeicoccus albus]NYI67286.1 Cu+-exporting ATPase [Spelaeicoccus albus]